MSSTKILVPGDVSIADDLNVTGETVARSGVRLTTPTSGPLVLSDAGDPNGVKSAIRGSLDLRSDAAELWQNTSSPSPGTVWSKIGGAGAFSGASYYSTGVQSATGGAYPAGPWNVLSYDASDYDTGGYWSAGSPTKLVAPSAGYYQVTAGVYAEAYPYIQVLLGLGKNVPSGGVTDPDAELFRVRSGSTVPTELPGSYPRPEINIPVVLNASGVVQLAAGDWVQAFVLIWSAGTFVVDAPDYCRFTISKVG